MAKKTILLVENDVPVRLALRSMLARDFAIVEAACCPNAVGRIDKSIDLALIDHSPQKGDGCEVLKALRKKWPDLPGIIMSGYGSESAAVNALRAGAIEYLKKPLNFPYVLKTVESCLSIKTSGSPHFQNAESRNDAIVDGIAAHIEENFDDKRLSLAALANRASMNNFKFCRLFKSRHGCGYVTFLNRVRIRNAATLLTNPELSITEIALAVGYGSIQHFERTFARTHGVSPREYRKQLKGQCTQ